MPKKHLNDPFIKSLKPEGKRIEYFDQHQVDPETNQIKRKGVIGLLLRMTKTGSKSFYFRYWYNDKSKRFKIGDYPNWKLSEAREKARKLAAKVNDGYDPQAEKRKKKQRSNKSWKFEELASEFKDKYLPTYRKNTRNEYRRIIDNELVPELGNIHITEISKNQIITILDRKAYKEDAPTMANRIRARLSRVLTFAVKRGLLEYNPVQAVPTYKKGKNTRDRFYDIEEIKELWQFFDNWQRPIQSIYKMLLITGQRKTETMHMKWDDITGDIWTIPAHKAKNKQAHEVPLSEMALNEIRKMESWSKDSPYVFPSPENSDKPIKWIKRATKNIKKQSEVSDFQPHDLRRTVATYMAKLGVDRIVLGKILNHKGLAGDDQVTAIYDRHGYMKEKRQAMNKWSNYLQKILAGETEANIYKIG